MRSIFVFGSNLVGAHGAGAALTARNHHGAIYGVGVGMTGNSYAIPTKSTPQVTLPIKVVKLYVDQFIDVAGYYSVHSPDITFQITRIGCGLAGFTDAQIAPLFEYAPTKTCLFDIKWRDLLPSDARYWGTWQ